MYLQCIICFLTSAGTETLAAITPTRIETGNISLARFEPTRRGCYVDKEFYFQNLNWDYAFRYSIKNCLYEGALQKIIPVCGCLPSFVEYNYNNLEICTGEKLHCALEQLKFMGSSQDPDMTMVQTAENKTKKCLQRCDLQTETIMTTTSTFC